jgi:hypothetical protein
LCDSQPVSEYRFYPMAPHPTIIEGKTNAV